jgi:sigma-B regulation protein RsbQ
LTYCSINVDVLSMGILEKHNVKVSGTGTRHILFAHGYGCDQNMWRLVAPAFEDRFRVVLFDYAGSGASVKASYSSLRHSSLQGYADDVLAIARELNLEDAIFVGHSVSSMIGVLAATKEPQRFDHLVMVGPSPRYINDTGYFGGFEPADIEGLLESLESNYLGWSSSMAPVIMGNSDRPELGQELTNSFCQMDPAVAKNFARATFLSDNRADLKNVKAKSLVLQCSDDVIAPMAVGEYVHKNIPKSEFVLMKATGHCPNLSAPQETIEAINAFLERSLAQ